MPQFNAFGSSANPSFGSYGGNLDLSFLSKLQGSGPASRPRLGFSQGVPTGPLSNYTSFLRARNTGPNKHLNSTVGGEGGQMGPPSLVDQLAAAGFNDAQRAQAAADMQFARQNNEIEGLRDFIGREAPRFEQIATQQHGELYDIADELLQQGAGDLDQFDQFRDKTLRETRSGVKGAIRDAQEATQGFGRAIEDYRNTGFQDASTSAAGIRESFQQGNQMADVGINPDGTRMTPQQQAAARMESQEAANRSVAQAVMPHLQRVNENILTANNALATMKQFESQTRLSGEGLMAGTATNFSGQRVELEKTAAAQSQVAASLKAQAAGLKSAAQLNSVMFEMQGRQLMADLVNQSPLGVVGLMPILAQVFAAKSAPGGNKLGGVSPALMNAGGKSSSPPSQGGMKPAPRPDYRISKPMRTY